MGSKVEFVIELESPTLSAGLAARHVYAAVGLSGNSEWEYFSPENVYEICVKLNGIFKRVI